MMRKLFIGLSALLLVLPVRAQVNKEITTANGLSSSLVLCLCQDKNGDIWIGTRNGLNKYNGLMVQAFRYDPADSCSLASNIVNTVLQDREGHLIVGTQTGVQVFDWETGTFSAPLATMDGIAYRDNVNTVMQRANGEVWVSGSRVFKIVFPETGVPSLVYQDFSVEGLEGTLHEDSAGHLWLAKYNDGLYRLGDDGTVLHLPQALFGGATMSVCSGPDRKLYLANNQGRVMSLDVDDNSLVFYESGALQGLWGNTIRVLKNGKVLVGTDGNGCFLLDPTDGGISPFIIENSRLRSSALKPHAFLEDREGNLWIGLYEKGVLMVPDQANPFRYLGYDSADADVVGSSSITSLLFDKTGALWVGTDNDGIYVLDGEGRLKRHYTVAEGLPPTIFGLTEDSRGNIWFGSFTKGVWRVETGTGRIRNSTAFSRFPNADHSIYDIQEDARGRLWMATLGSGLYYYDLKAGGFVVPAITRDLALNRWQNDVLVRDDGRVWVASFGGLYELDARTDEVKLLRQLLPGHIVYTLHDDGEVVYAGMADGLAVVDPAGGDPRIYTTQDGLPDNSISAVLSVAPGQVWVSTGSGLARFDRRTGKTEGYYSGDGIRVREFSWNAAALSPAEDLFFGGKEGIVYFDPDRISKQVRMWTPRIVGFQAPNRYFPVTEDLRYTLEHDAKTCTVYFTTAEYDAPEGLVFAYSTDRRNWSRLHRGENSVTLSDLKPGKYTFSVKVIDDTVESEPVSVSIRVLRPWWGSAVATAVYILLALLLFGLLYYLWRQQWRDRQELVRQKQVQQANEDKVRFFINMSHEIRSPMTLVMAPLQKLMETDPDPARQRSYAVMDRNSRHILQVVNQMLDLRKAEQGQMKMSFSPVNLVEFCSSICSMFQEQARLKGLNLSFRYAGTNALEVWMDRSYLDKVLINLLSNALKFTPSGGTIGVLVWSEGDKAVIAVKDSGSGMSQTMLEHAFQRFYQEDPTVSGTGIGLNLAQMIVHLHHGSITAANNTDGPGSVFTVTLPLGNAHLSDEEMAPRPNAGLAAEDDPAGFPVLPELAAGNASAGSARRHKTLLLAEDNADIRQYLRDELSDEYHILESADGKEAYELILRKTPDVVISDVIMPQMDGYELCRKIRHNPNVGHLPVILLTAKVLEQDRIDGLDVGADAYLTKPFNIEVLRKTVSNLLRSRSRLKVSYSEPKVKDSDIKEVGIKTPDDRLMERVLRVVNARLDDPELTVDAVAHEVGLSRVHLYRKIKELTNMTTNEFIKNLRLKKAAEMLSSAKYSIAELSDAVGFASATYFATAFKDLYGMTPSEYAKKASDPEGPSGK